MPYVPTPQTRLDAHTVYERVFEWHGAIMLADVEALGADWLPRSRVQAAVELLISNGVARRETWNGKPLLRLATPPADG